MTEVRRIRMKFGDAEFEADVQENKVQPMYTQFLCMLRQRKRTPPLSTTGGRTSLAGMTFSAETIMPPVESFHYDRRTNGADNASPEPPGAVEAIMPLQSSDDELLMRIFELQEDGAVILKVLPSGPDMNADAMLLLLYGYYRLKNESHVLATQLFRAAEQSGVSLRRPDNVKNGRFVNRGGERKGSHYALNSHGLAMAKEITARMIG